MKKLIYTFVFIFCFAFAAKAQYVNIPDSNFGKFLIQQYPSCLYKDVNNLYWMDTTCGAVVNEDSLIYGSMITSERISSLQGIQYFKKLSYLDCSTNELSSLPVLPNSLKHLTISANKFINPPVLPDSLRFFRCVMNLLTSLPNLPNTLDTLVCSFNSITNLPKLPNSLLFIDAMYNNISTLPPLPNSLKELYIADNSLYCLPMLPNSLTNLSFDGKKIKCLPNYPNGIIVTNSDTTRTWSAANVCNSTNNPNNCPTYTQPANYVNIPDSNFGKFLITKYPSCLYKDVSGLYWMDTTCGAVVNETSLDCSNKNIANITGIEYFKSLQALGCSSNSISKMPPIANSIVKLWCDNNLLDSLPNQLPDSLQFFYCFSNNLKSISQLPNNLLELACHSQHGFLNSLPTLPNKIVQLDCTHNQITQLPNLPNSLQLISCDDNNIYCLPKLPQSLIGLSADLGTKINCLPNIPSGLTTTLPICNPTNNPNQCHIYPSISGNVFTDNNSNSTKDTNEYYRPFVKLSLNNGQTTYTNLNGNYNITLDTLGSYTLKITPPPFYKAVPDSVNITVTQGNPQIILPDIALQPITVIDSFIVKHVSLNRPRPGFNYALSVGYANMGTVNSTQNNIVSLLFDSSLLHFDSAGLPVQSLSYSSNFGLASFNAGSLVAGQWNIFNTYFTVKPTAPIGDSIFTIAAITYGTTKAGSKDSARIVGSYDPNDKQATPQLSIQQVQNGEYIDYVIHFQNLGTDSAVNIVIADTLSNLLSYSYLQVVGSSHNANLSYSIGNGILYFEFLNIKLPPASVNEPLSHGYIHFRIKALPSLAVGAIIPNKASIYFDYNLPVVTNTATTSIESIITPVRIINYTINAVTENNSIVGIQNKWITGTEVNVSHYTIERSLNGKEFIAVGEVAAQGLTNYSFTDKLSNNYSTVIFYRLKVVDKDGKYFYTSVQSIELKANNNNGLSIYPNPSKGAFTIATQLVKQVIIIDVLGKTVVEKTFNGQQTNFTYQLNKGIYWVKCMMQNGEMKTEKLVIE